MNRLIEIYVDGVKNIEDSRFSLTDRNLLLDFNGTGKTALLDAVSILVTGRHPTLGDRIVDIVGLLPADKKKLVIEGTFESKDIIRREFIRGVDSNTQIITINGKKIKTKTAELQIKDMFGDFVSNFNIHKFGEMTDKEKQEAFFTQFADKLSKLTCQDVREACTLQILKESEFYDGTLKFVYNKTSIKELTKKVRKEFKSKVIEKFSEQKNLYKHFKYITETIFPGIDESSIQDFIEEINEAVKSYKNDLQQEVEAAKKSLEKDREMLDVSLNVAQLKKDKEKNGKFLKTLRKDVEDYNSYLVAKKTFDAAVLALIPKDVEDDKDLKIKLKKLRLEIQDYDKLNSQYKTASEINYLEKLADLKAAYKEKLKTEEKLKQKHKDLEANKKNLQIAISKKDKDAKALSELNEKYTAAQAKDSAIVQKILKADGVLKEYTSEEEEIQKLLENFKGGRCPTCLTKVAQIALNIDEKNERLDELIDLINKQTGIVSRLNLTEEESLKIVTDMKGVLNKNEADLKEEYTNVDDLEKDKKISLDAIEELTTEINSIKITPKIIEDMEKKQENYSNLKNKIQKLQDKREKVDKIEEKLEKIAEDTEFNKTLGQKKKSLVKPKIISLDEKIEEAIEGCEQTIETIEEKLETAFENRGIQKKIKILEDELLQTEAATKFVRKACGRIEEYKYNLISDLLRPVRDRADKIYKPIFNDGVAFDVERCGILRNKNYVPLKYMSGGQRTAFIGSLLSAIMAESDIKTKILCIEASEVDDTGLLLLLQSMNDVAMDNIFVSAFPRHDINMKPGKQPEGWNTFAIR